MKIAKFDWDNADPGEPAAHVFVGKVVRDDSRPREPRAVRARSKQDGLEDLRPTNGMMHAFGQPGVIGFHAPAVLVINSYAGSLVQAAKDGGYTIAGSYEDAAYGLGVQRLNFPELDGLWAGSRKHWPDADLADRVVFAHPPCAAFSAQNRANVDADGKNSHMGVDAAKFQCTVDVVDYALGHHAMALAVESVPGALEGARECHDGLAAKHGYRLFRVLQNAVTFGLPQWRPRFWAVFMRQDVCGEAMPFVLRPKFRSVADVVLDAMAEDDAPWEDDVKKIAKQRQVLSAGGIDPDLALTSDEDGFLIAVLSRLLKKTKAELVHLILDSKFEAQTLRLLGSKSVATTLVHNSWWWTRGRLVSKMEFNEIMGFPRTWRFPPGMHAVTCREFLSRGVCPPVATWLMDQIARTIDKGPLPLRGVAWCEDGGVVDLTPPVKSRKALLESVS